jgi:hypothetical protein
LGESATESPEHPLEGAADVAIALPLQAISLPSDHSTSQRPARESPEQKTLAQCDKKRIISNTWCREPTTPRHA